MDFTIHILEKICMKHRFEEKLLFVPSYSIGHQIGEYLAREGTSWINLKTTTTAGYAQELLFSDINKDGVRPIDSQESLFIVEKLFRDDDLLGKEGCYFEGAAEVPGIIKVLSNAVFEIRMAGLDHKSVDVKAFIIPEKGEEITRLLYCYDRFLQENSLIDHPGLISKAIKKLETAEESQNNMMVMVLSDFPLSSLEKEMISLAGGETLTVVGHRKPLNINCPERVFKISEPDENSTTKPKTNIELLPWLFEPEKAADPFDDNTVSMFDALGESNEIRETFRRILREGTPLDDVEILVTRSDPYVSMIYESAVSFGVPVTFAEGVPVPYARPGKALILYLKWQAEDFCSSYLRQLFSGGYLDFGKFELKGEKPSSGRAAKIVREAGIGWDRERYCKRLRALKESYMLKADKKREQGEEKSARWTEQAAAKVEWVACLIDKILATIPRPDAEGTVSMDMLCRGAMEFLQKFCRVAGELDAQAKLRLLERLESLAHAPSLSYFANDAAERLIKILSGVSVGHSSPKPGHVHVANYRSGAYSGRSNTFVLGLNQAGFPGTLRQDPVILDVERRKLGGRLILASSRLEENVYSMAKLLAASQGKITLSCPCRDLREDRELFPSSLMLGVYRLITTDRGGDYRALINFLGEPAGFIPFSDIVPLNNWEWWLARKDARYGSDSVHAAYQHLFEGERAETKRDDEILSEYDGWIPSSAGTMNPLTGDLILSCSRLESLARCPFAYFLRYVLGIEPLEEIEKDTGQWLDPLQRGELLHDVFYRFMEELKSKGELPVYEKHFEMLDAIGMDQVEHWKTEIPPANDLVFNREVENIRQALGIFLKNEEQHCKQVEPCFFELSFGMAEDSEPGVSPEEPVKIGLKPRGSFKLRGRIDRVDRCRPHEYEIWDYKTGGTFGYKDQGYLDRGRRLQHALYALATEVLLRRKVDKKARVVGAGYFFPSLKGEGRRIRKEQIAREELYEVLDELFCLLQEGVFPASYDEEPCGICEYNCVCGGKDVAVGRTKKKLAADKKMDPLRRLKGHA